MFSIEFFGRMDSNGLKRSALNSWNALVPGVRPESLAPDDLDPDAPASPSPWATAALTDTAKMETKATSRRTLDDKNAILNHEA